jgi:hypothetical protein
VKRNNERSIVRTKMVTERSVFDGDHRGYEMQSRDDFMGKYYTTEAWAKRNQIREQTPPEKLKEYGEAWRRLFLKVEAALNLDPAGEAAQALAKEWVLLAEAVSGGDSGLKAGGIEAWKDHQNWPSVEQDALFARYGLASSNDRSASMLRVERGG